MNELAFGQFKISFLIPMQPKIQLTFKWTDVVSAHLYIIKCAILRAFEISRDVCRTQYTQRKKSCTRDRRDDDKRENKKKWLRKKLVSNKTSPTSWIIKKHQFIFTSMYTVETMKNSKWKDWIFAMYVWMYVQVYTFKV